MPTFWEHTVHVICTAEAMPGAIAALDLAFPRDDGSPRNPATPELYGCQLSASGAEPVTHYGSSFVVTEPIRQRLEGLGLAQAHGVTYWRCTNPGGELIATNHEGANPSQMFFFDDAILSLNLQRIQPAFYDG